MADTLPNVQLPAGQWVNLYTATGITVGTQIQVQNLGGSLVLVHTGDDVPTSADGFNIIRPDSLTFVSQIAPTGAYAMSETDEGLLNVGEA